MNNDAHVARLEDLLAWSAKDGDRPALRAAICALSADRGEAVAYRWWRNGEPQGFWINGQPTQQQFAAAENCKDRAEWTIEYAYAATPPSPAESPDPFAAKLRADILADDSLAAAPSQVSDAVLPPLPSPCELRNYTGNVPFMYYTADQMRHYLLDGLAAQPQPGRVEAKPLADWHEDQGPAVWWLFPMEEAAWIGTPNDSDWPGYHTHWTPHPSLPTAGGDA